MDYCLQGNIRSLFIFDPFPHIAIKCTNLRLGIFFSIHKTPSCLGEFKTGVDEIVYWCKRAKIIPVYSIIINLRKLP